MSRSIGPAHIIRQHDGTSTGIWGSFSLESAFQPVFAFHRGNLSITAYEGLIRPWRDGEASAPETFFDAVPAADRPRAEALARTLHLLNAAACLPPDVSIFVSFDPLQFADRTVAEGTMRDVRLVINGAGIDPRRLVCKVTEQTSAAAEATFACVEMLRASGLRIALDHGGAVEAGIGRIVELRPEVVRFDAAQTARMMSSGSGFALVAATVSTLAGEAVDTLFDGIEDGQLLEFALRSGASMVQGYVLARAEHASAHITGPVTPEIAAPLSRPAAERSARPPSRPFGRRLPS